VAFRTRAKREIHPVEMVNHGQGDRRREPYRRPNNPKDGYRALAVTTEGKIQLRSRNDTAEGTLSQYVKALALMKDADSAP
jgi:hypothetical protein